ncbi:MAG: hypothetical protein WKG01_37420 [Kofleriaceae bacterium]
MKSISLVSVLSCGALAITAVPSRADQCALNPTAIADKAATLVKPGATVLEYCEPCRGGAPGKPYVVKTVEAKDGKLIVNGKLTDLAYLFVQTSPDKLENVGILAGCAAQGVSVSITGGKPSGQTSPGPNGTRRPAPPPPSPASAAEFAGAWNVRLTTRLSSCTSIVAPGVADWTIAVADGAVSLESGDGSKLAGTLDKVIGSSYRTTLRPSKQASSAVLKATMIVKDRLHGTLVRSENTGDPQDPVCVIVQDFGATRR